MFVNPKILKKLMKEAFKSKCLIVGCREGLYLQGVYWKFHCDKKFVPKTIWAEIIELTGEIPEEGDCFCAGKDGNQMQMNPMEIETPEKAEGLELTDFILLSSRGVEQRILQLWGGEKLLLNNIFIQGVRGKWYDEEQGEMQPEEPRYKDGQVFWKNNVMRFAACIRVDDEHEKILSELKVNDLMVPES